MLLSSKLAQPLSRGFAYHVLGNDYFMPYAEVGDKWMSQADKTKMFELLAPCGDIDRLWETRVDRMVRGCHVLNYMVLRPDRLPGWLRRMWPFGDRVLWKKIAKTVAIGGVVALAAYAVPALIGYVMHGTVPHFISKMINRAVIGA